MNPEDELNRQLTPGRARRFRWGTRSRRGSPTPDALELLKPGASLTRLSERSGLDHDTLAKLFAGKTLETMRATTLLKTAAALHKHPARVFEVIARYRDAKRVDAGNATGETTNATTTDGQTRDAARARHLGPATITPHGS
jgi:lambda repressor-like predicted transcriptional regulator